MRLIRRVISKTNESDPNEPVKLLEVNEATSSDGIRPVFFAPHRASGIDFPSAIIEITPDEYASLLRNASQLPNGWELGEELHRPAHAVVG